MNQFWQQPSEFVEQNVAVTRSPVSVDLLDKGLDQLFAIHPAILDNSILDQRNIDVITGHTQTQHFSYPIITEQVGYLVSTLFNEGNKNFELVWVYVFQNPGILHALLEFLANLEVNNMDHLQETIMYLRELYWSINPKTP